MTTIDAPRVQQISTEGILSRAFHVLNDLGNRQKAGTF
ncbi:MAG: hypothetical protein QOH55_721 [Microbacteriaceae bacterium]|jgi:hypothetical protein|nr:hypothetical protein [Microbacteriaceae bacterium]